MPTYKLKDLVDEVISGEWGQEITDGDTGVKVIRTTNFSNTGKLNMIKDVVLRNIEADKVEKKKLIVGDTIIEKSGGSPEQPVGRVVYFEEDEVYLCNNFTSVLRPNKELVVPKYFMYLMYNLHRTRKVLKFQNKTTGIINLKLDQYLNQTTVSVPSMDVQMKVVKVLDQTFELINKRQSQIAALEELTQSVFLKMFGDPLSDNNKFTKKPLKEFGEIITGNTPSRKEAENFGDYIEWIKSDNINTPSCYLTQAEEYLSEEGMKKGRVVPENSILVTCIAGSRSSIGNTAISRHTVAFNQQINAIIPSVNTYYLYTHFLVGKELVQRASTNGMKGLVNKSAFQQIEFLYPPKELQDKFGYIFLEIQKQKEVIESSLVELEYLYNGCLKKAFKGELFQDRA